MSNLETKWQDFFPYDPRPAQLKILNPLEKLIAEGKHCIIEAANGTGKTIAALSAALPAAKRHDKVIVYLARTHSQMDRVIEELGKINEIKSVKVSGLTMRGRNSMCLNDLVLKFATNPRSAGEMCTQLKSLKKCQYFKNMADETTMAPVFNELQRKPATAEIIFELAEAAAICPAETARKLLSSVDVIAGSYLYMFDPRINTMFLDQTGVELDDLILVVDECHNLPDTAIDIGSDELTTFSFSRAIREARDEGQTNIIPFFDACQEFFAELSVRNKIGQEVPIDASEILEKLELMCDLELDDEFFDDLITLGIKIRTKLLRKGKEPRSSIGRIGEFFYLWYESIGRNEFTHSVEVKTIEGNQRNRYAILRLSSLDPRRVLMPILSEVYASVHLTGTLGDPEAYAKLTGLENLPHEKIILPSPYERKNIAAYFTGKLSTLYSHRSPETYRKIADLVMVVADETPKNIGVFAPSYQIVEELFRNGLDQYRTKPIFRVPSEATSEENDRIVKRFKKEASKEGGILISVLGGRSSEGTDFPGHLMNSVVVIGIPYAPPNPRIQAKINFLEENFPGLGRTLGYEIPAVNKASQAAGRAVRSLDDRAFILFVDFRYGSYKVKKLLPNWLRTGLKKIDPKPENIERAIRNFFEEK
ncbi:MAG: hypothetical protein D6732_22260 [Methanobacteriota archaeon]|nr:MAG: hypothetical protein D6732_22260 [Euryarchaeota archaeon]